MGEHVCASTEQGVWDEINTANRAGLTPLIAARRLNKGAVRFLADKVYVEERNELGETALRLR